MDWWWKPKPASSSAKADDPPTLPTPTSKEPVAAPTPAAVPVFQTPKPALTRDEQAEQEWATVLKELQAEAALEPARESKPREQEAESHATPVPNDISPNSLYPTEMSCRSSFDYAMFCQSFGGQFVNVYRYGSFRSCSNHWDDFFLCMKVRNWKKEDRQRAIQEHYRKKAVKWKTGPSSEDIWEVRTEPVENPVSGNLAELEAQLKEAATEETNWTPAK